MHPKLKIAIARLILIQIIPIIGVIFFEWELFEVAITYILETTAIYLVYELDHFFIDKRTRLPIHFAVLQLAFTMMTFTAMMYASAMIMFTILTPPMSNMNNFTDLFMYKLEHMEILFPFVSLFIIELITYYIKKRSDYAHISNSTWRMVRRILYSHLYMVASLMILSIFPQNLIVFIPFFIGLKMVFEYSTEDERIFKALWTKFLETKFGSQFKPKPKKNRTPYEP